MKNLPVHWYEGLFLRPHHLQAADRYWTELFSTSLQSDNPYNYGLISFEVSQEALGNHQFEVRTLKARMRDGTLIDFTSEGEQPDRVDIKGAMDDVAQLVTSLDEAFEKESAVRVYLAVPRLKLGRNNCSSNGHDPTARYSEVRFPVDDENRGGFEQQVQFRGLNARLLLSTEDLAGHELLPIAQIRRAGEGDATPELDETFIAPTVVSESSSELKSLVRGLFDVIGQNVERLSQQVVNRGLSRNSEAPADLDRYIMLDKLNEAYATLSVMAFAMSIHPLDMYTELCRILGRLSIFTTAKRATSIPAYDHEDLGRIFPEVIRRIREAMRLPDVSFERRYFLGAGLGMQASLEPTWFHSNWDWCIGVKTGGLSTKECRELLSSSGLDWKLGSSREVENIFLRGAEGLNLELLDRPMHGLPAKQDWIYYQVRQDDTPGSAWFDVVQTQTLAMRLKDSLILNKDRLQGEKEIVVAAKGQKVHLQFALFAIPNAD